LFRSRPRAAIGAALFGAFALLVFHGPVYFHHFPVDDAFITFRYSKHLADGLGPNWNSEGHVEGYTSFLWMALLAAANKLGVDISDAARVFDYLTTFGTMVAVVAIWRLWSSASPGSGVDSPLVLAVALLAIAVIDGIAFWGFSGMETPLFMFLLTAGAYIFLRDRRSTGAPWSAVAFAALALARPEGVIAAAVTGLFALDGVQDPLRRRRAILRAATWAAIFLALFGAYFLWRYSYYGYPFPNTYYAKVDTPGDVLQRGAGYVSAAALAYHLLPMYAGAALLLLIQPLRRDAAYVVALTAVLLLAAIPEGGDVFGHGRFIVPVLPLLYLAGISGYAMALASLPFDAARKSLAAVAVVGLAGLLLLRRSDNSFLPDAREAQVERKLLGVWLSEHTPEDYTIAAWAVGSIAYYSDRDVLDLLGLNDEVIAHTEIDGFGTGIAGHEKYNADYVLEIVQPEIIVTGDADPAPLDEEAFWLTYGGAGGLPAKAAIMTDPRLRAMYDVRSVEIQGRWFNYLQRRNTIATTPDG